tara:strand:- start:112 stop:297 length:186 start_codon:yes stop_codon:yes gene_type:complete
LKYLKENKGAGIVFLITIVLIFFQNLIAKYYGEINSLVCIIILMIGLIFTVIIYRVKRDKK